MSVSSLSGIGIYSNVPSSKIGPRAPPVPRSMPTRNSNALRAAVSPSFAPQWFVVRSHIGKFQLGSAALNAPYRGYRPSSGYGGANRQARLPPSLGARAKKLISASAFGSRMWACSRQFVLSGPCAQATRLRQPINRSQFSREREFPRRRPQKRIPCSPSGARLWLLVHEHNLQ